MHDFLLIFNQVKKAQKQKVCLGQWSHVLPNALHKAETDPSLIKDLSDDLLERYYPGRSNCLVKERTQVLYIHRYIGVIYRPESELVSHYSSSSLSTQYDAVIHIDKTKALPPIDQHPDFHSQANT